MRIDIAQRRGLTPRHVFKQAGRNGRPVGAGRQQGGSDLQGVSSHVGIAEAACIRRDGAVHKAGDFRTQQLYLGGKGLQLGGQGIDNFASGSRSRVHIAERAKIGGDQMVV